MRILSVCCVALIGLSACSTVTHTLKAPFRIAPAPSSGSFKVGLPYKIEGRWYTPEESYSHKETGIASWYGPNFHGKLTANGEVYNQDALTAAHRTLQMPSIARVTNLENGRSIIVRINDRGPFAHGRIIDMSSRGADLLRMKRKGTAKVRVQLLEKESRMVAEAAKRGENVGGVEIALNQGKPIEQILGGSRYAHLDAAPAAPLVTAPASPLPSASARPASILDPAPEPAMATVADASPTAVTPPEVLPLAQEQAFVKSVPIVPTQIYVQAAAFSSPENAQSFAAQLSNFGQTAVSTIDRGGQTFYRVRFGPFPSVDNADNLLNALASAGQDQAIIIVE